MTSADESRWDAYVHRHPDSTHCHLTGWKHVIENTYGHRSYYLLAETDSEMVGVLPLFHIKSLLFGNQLVSMPFLDCGGVIGNSRDVIETLVQQAIEIGAELRVDSVELRQATPFNIKTGSWHPTGQDKVRMVLKLPPSSEELFSSFKAKLRSQIRRPQKEGMRAVIGGSEHLTHFYEVFSSNMRDLGSPVHAADMFNEVFRFLDAKISVVFYGNRPAAAAIMILYRETAHIPWASSLRRYNGLSPNMLLYWRLLECACNQGTHFFDFGRSSTGEGTYRFKQQWEAESIPLHWRQCNRTGTNGTPLSSLSRRFHLALQAWQMLPLTVTLWFGPMLRKYISL